MHAIDPLTGLPNRLGLAARLDHAIAVARREGGSAAVLFVDIDGFKAVNDGRGHAAGDAVLRELAARLRARLRDTDTVARLGGDEFVVVAERMGDARQASTLAKKLLAVIADPIEAGGETFGVTASIGISLCPEDGQQGEALIAAADAAMYAAKRGGKDAFRYYSPRMHDAAHARLALEEALRDGLERGELECRFQPEWDVARGRMSACAARLHWDRPGLGVLRPEDFVAVADHGRLSASLARWTVAQVAAAAARLRAAGCAAPLGMRFTARQIANRGLAGEVARELRRHGLPGRAIRAEIADGGAIPPTRDAAATVRDLHALGVPVALAGFGTGASAIGSLVAAPVEAVILARELVAAAADEKSSGRLVEAIVAMGRPLGIRVIAEGVDDARVAERLAAVGCQVMRGDHFTPMMPLAGLASLTARGDHVPPIADRCVEQSWRWSGRAWRAAVDRAPGGRKGRAGHERMPPVAVAS